ncbi:SAG-related sequence SRS22A [Besnoitia besnoiti]|uniref:SAG-related sequence SRS22A n=1 Tax=Besnoitia besnoiti TaxID=94643 RepID=A0A2A9M6Z4_BESBE|nr:SAG-related sequence SRS22A [Besnoitia besnoiti]PFH32964.1 SAG-related sequence SRS22A [Besnoitia besnoiti]
MRLSIVPLGSAAAVLLAIQQAAAIRVADHQDPMKPAEPEVPPTCSDKSLELAVAAPNSGTAFRCPANYSLLPSYSDSKTLVFYKEKPESLSSILPDAKLTEKPVPEKARSGPQETNASGAIASGSEGDVKEYTLSVTALPQEKKVLTLKCGPSPNTQPAVASNQDTDQEPKECVVTITVASTGASTGFRPAVGASAVTGLLSMAVAGALQLLA